MSIPIGSVERHYELCENYDMILALVLHFFRFRPNDPFMKDAAPERRRSAGMDYPTLGAARGRSAGA